MHNKLLRTCALAGSAIFVIAGCGGGSSNAKAGADTTTPTTAANAGTQQSAFRECLEKHGVKLPAGFGNGGRPSGPGSGGPPGGGTPGSLPAGVDQQKLQAAMQACAGSVPEGGFPGRGGADPQAMQAYVSCLSDHGVKVPTSTSGSTPGGGRPAALGTLRADPNFEAANKTCQPLLPSFGATTTTTAR